MARVKQEETSLSHLFRVIRGGLPLTLRAACSRPNGRTAFLSLWQLLFLCLLFEVVPEKFGVIQVRQGKTIMMCLRRTLPDDG